MEQLKAPGLNEMFDLLTHPHRRYILYYLTKESETANIDSLAAMITKRDGGLTGPDQRNDRKAVEVALRHSHLPKLAEAGTVSINEKRDSIELGETDGIERFLDDSARIDGYMQTAAGD